MDAHAVTHDRQLMQRGLTIEQHIVTIAHMSMHNVAKLQIVGGGRQIFHIQQIVLANDVTSFAAVRCGTGPDLRTGTDACCAWREREREKWKKTIREWKDKGEAEPR